MHSEIVEMLTNAHRMMEHVLTLIRLQVDLLNPHTDAVDFVFLQKAIGYMHNYPGLIHHPAEELMFECLQRRAPDTLHLCTKLTEQHKQFTILEITLLEYIGQAQNGDRSAGELVRKLCDTYCVEHFDHLSVEENELLPRGISVLTEKDWLDIAYKSNLDMDPLSNPNLLKHHDSLYDYIMSTNLILQAH